MIKWPAFPSIESKIDCFRCISYQHSYSRCVCWWHHSLLWTVSFQYEWLGFPWWLSSEESACQCRRGGFNTRIRKIPWRRTWQCTPVFLSGKSHGQRSLMIYSAWDHKRVRHNVATKQQQPINDFISHQGSWMLGLHVFISWSFGKISEMYSIYILMSFKLN